MQPRNIPVVYREPFAFGHTPSVRTALPGTTVLEMVKAHKELSPDFLVRGVVCINGQQVPREMWAHVRPQSPSDTLPICVTMHWPLQGGGGGNNTLKSVVAIVAAVALTIVTYGIATGAILGAETAAFGAAIGVSATVGANIVAGVVGLAGALALSYLTAPPTQADATAAGSNNVDNPDAAAASANVIGPGGAIPRVIGTRKCFPPFACEPLVELVDADEYVEALFVLNGPHQLEDIRVDGVSIDEADDIEFETREGWPDDSEITLIDRQGKTSTPQIRLSQHVTASDNIHLAHPSQPETDLPIFHGVATKNDTDEIWIHLLCPGGIANGGSTRMSIPLRVRMRLRGTSSWINLPEIHVAGDVVSQLRFALLFKWQEVSDLKQTVSTDNGFWYAHRAPPPQDPSAPPVTPTNRLWVTDSYFDSGSGNDYYYNGVEAASRLINFNLFKNRAEFYLKEATFPRGIYEIQIMRGCAIVPSTLSKTTYVYGATVFDFFWYTSTTSPQMLVSHANVSDQMSLVRVISVWNQKPILKEGFATIAIRAVNRQVQRVSVQASGYVRDWDGSGWNNWVVTSNPAPHYVDVLSGSLNLDPLPVDLRDDTGLLAWRDLCIANNWTCDAIIDDMRTQDVLTLLASCAYAKPYQSDQYSVTVDNDRSGDVPIQVFSRVNTANLKFTRAFVRPPEGFVVTYRNNVEDDDRAQAIVFQRDPSIATTGLFEQVTYDGLVDETKVRARALFDLDQINLRSTFYSFDTDIESIVCRRGSLVALQSDVLTSRAGDGHIKTKTLDSNSPASKIVGFVLDSMIPITNEVDMHGIVDMHTVVDMHDVGVKTGIALRHTDGSLSTHQLSNVTGETDTLTLTTPIPNDATILGFDDTSDEYGCEVVSGELNTEYRRMLVQGITPARDLTANITLVDEAPTLVRPTGTAMLTAMDDITLLQAMGTVSDHLESM